MEVSRFRAALVSEKKNILVSVTVLARVVEVLSRGGIDIQ
jgi:hypothetical protein